MRPRTPLHEQTERWHHATTKIDFEIRKGSHWRICTVCWAAVFESNERRHVIWHHNNDVTKRPEWEVF